jgi:hypothetical protein
LYVYLLAQPADRTLSQKRFLQQTSNLTSNSAHGLML